MPTGIPIEDRLQLIREIFMVVGHQEFILEAAGPKIDSFHLTQAILEDTTFGCTTRQRLIGALKKSPLWERVKPFLTNDDRSCGVKGCQHRSYYHANKVGPCSKSIQVYNSHNVTTHVCECQGFKQKSF